MSIDVFWDDLNILTISKKDNLFISSVNEDNLIEAKKSGFPIYFLKQISLVSDELPNIVRNRLSNINNIKDKIKFKNNYNDEEIEESIYNYINTTECRRPTDKFKINIEVN
jgi:hypothetical protein